MIEEELSWQQMQLQKEFEKIKVIENKGKATKATRQRQKPVPNQDISQAASEVLDLSSSLPHAERLAGSQPEENFSAEVGPLCAGNKERNVTLEQVSSQDDKRSSMTNSPGSDSV